MLELEVIPEHGLTSENIEFILGEHDLNRNLYQTSYSIYVNLIPKLLNSLNPFYARITKIMKILKFNKRTNKILSPKF